MNKDSYMSELKEKLSIFDDEVAKEIIDDYEEHFKAGISNGKTEEMICSELGDIDTFIEELKEVYETKKTNKINFEFDFNFGSKKTDEEKSEFEKKLKGAINGAAKSLSGLGGEIKKQLSQYDFEPVIKNVGSVLSDIGDTIKKEFENVKANVRSENSEEFHEDVESYTFSTTGDGEEEKSCNITIVNVNEGKEEVSEADTFNVEEKAENAAASADEEGCQEKAENIPCTKVVIEADCADVKMVKSENDKFTLNYFNKSGLKDTMLYSFEGKQEGDTFHGKVSKNKKVSGLGFFGMFTSPSIEIKMNIPENMELIKINGISGDVSAENLSVQNLEINSKSGDISVENCNGQSVSLTTASGDIELENGVYENVITTTASGDVDISDIKTINMKAVCMSGDIDASDIVTENVKISSKSGDCDVSDITAKAASVSSISGDVDVTNATIEKLVTFSVSGDVEIGSSKCAGLVSENTSGDTTVNVENATNGSFKSISGDIAINIGETDGYEAVVNTKAGDVTLVYEGVKEKNANGKVVMGNGESKIEVSTISGDVNVEA